MYIAKREELMRRRLAINLNKKELSLKAGLPANAIGRREKTSRPIPCEPVRLQKPSTVGLKIFFPK